MQAPNVIWNPGNEWVLRLRRDNVVFAPKEDKYMMVNFAYGVPELGHCSVGHIGLQYLWFECGEWGIDSSDGMRYHEWFIKPNGRGFDGEHILLPCEGYLANDPPKMSEPWVRQVERRLANVDARLDQLESARVDSWSEHG